MFVAALVLFGQGKGETRAKLSDGSQVELVALAPVCNCYGWWKPDGSSIDIPLERQFNAVVRMFVPAGNVILLGITVPPECRASDEQPYVKGADNNLLIGAVPHEAGSWECLRPFPFKPISGSLTFSVAASKWNEVGRVNYLRSSKISEEDPFRLQLVGVPTWNVARELDTVTGQFVEKTTPGNEESQVTFKVPDRFASENFKIQAIDDQGATFSSHADSFSRETLGGKLTGTERFSLPAASICQLRFYVRPIYSVTFQNVSSGRPPSFIKHLR